MEVMEWPRGTYIYSQMANDGWRDFEPGFLQRVDRFVQERFVRRVDDYDAVRLSTGQCFD